MNKAVFKAPIRRFIKGQINGGAILLIVAVIAMIIANSPFREHYNAWFAKEVVLQFGEFSFFRSHGQNMSFLALINDALMAIFFFSVGLEIKREILVGELSSPRKALLPVIAACGGMLVPVLLFLLVCPDGEATKGAAIPMATDIAFSLGVLSLLGKRVPLSLKIFLTAFAVVDDIGGIIIIGLFYSSDLIPQYLLWALLFLGILYLGGHFHITSKLFYTLFGIAVWYLFLNSGIHPTIAGVMVAFTVPARPKFDLAQYTVDIRNSLTHLPNKIFLRQGHQSPTILRRQPSSLGQLYRHAPFCLRQRQHKFQRHRIVLPQRCHTDPVFCSGNRQTHRHFHVYLAGNPKRLSVHARPHE